MIRRRASRPRSRRHVRDSGMHHRAVVESRPDADVDDLDDAAGNNDDDRRDHHHGGPRHDLGGDNDDERPERPRSTRSCRSSSGDRRAAGCALGAWQFDRWADAVDANGDPVAPSIGPGTAVAVSNLGPTAIGATGRVDRGVFRRTRRLDRRCHGPAPRPTRIRLCRRGVTDAELGPDAAPARRVDAWARDVRRSRRRCVRRGTRRRDTRRRRPTRGDRSRRRWRRRGAGGVRVRAAGLDSRRTRRSRRGSARRHRDRASRRPCCSRSSTRISAGTSSR